VDRAFVEALLASEAAEVGALEDLDWLGVMGREGTWFAPSVDFGGGVVNPTDVEFEPGGEALGFGGGMSRFGENVVGGLSEFVLGSRDPKGYLEDLFGSLGADELFELMDVLAASGVIAAGGARPFVKAGRTVGDLAGAVVDGFRRVKYTGDPKNIAAAERAVIASKRGYSGGPVATRADNARAAEEILSRDARALYPRSVKEVLTRGNPYSSENTLAAAKILNLHDASSNYLQGLDERDSGSVSMSYRDKGQILDENEMLELLDQLNRR